MEVMEKKSDILQPITQEEAKRLGYKQLFSSTPCVVIVANEDVKRKWDFLNEELGFLRKNIYGFKKDTLQVRIKEIEEEMRALEDGRF